MKRDMDLVREILLRVEEHPTPYEPIAPFVMEGIEETVAYHHVYLLDQAGLLNAMSRKSVDEWYPLALTWAGHDFLDAVRDPEVWAKTKKGAAAAGGLTVDLLRDLAKGFLKKKVEELTGVQL